MTHPPGVPAPSERSPSPTPQSDSNSVPADRRPQVLGHPPPRSRQPAAGPGRYTPDTGCAASADRRGDPLFATAPPAERWLLIELNAPWPRTALTALHRSTPDPHRATPDVATPQTDPRRSTSEFATPQTDPRRDVSNPAALQADPRRAEQTATEPLSPAPDPPDTLGAEVARICAALRCRPVLIRRHGRSTTREPRRWFLVDSRPGHESIHTGELPTDEHLLQVLSGADPGTPTTDPIYLVCTHGRHDACCAVRGRPAAAALTATYPTRTWECSHIGGDRFAANLVFLPHSLFYGHVPANQAVALAKAYDQRLIVPTYYRGSGAQPPPVQAAQHFARQAGHPTSLNTLHPTAIHQPTPNTWSVTLTTPAPASNNPTTTGTAPLTTGKAITASNDTPTDAGPPPTRNPTASTSPQTTAPNNSLAAASDATATSATIAPNDPATTGTAPTATGNPAPTANPPTTAADNPPTAEADHPAAEGDPPTTAGEPTTAANASASTSDATATDVGTTSSTDHSTAPTPNATTSTDDATATTAPNGPKATGAAPIATGNPTATTNPPTTTADNPSAAEGDPPTTAGEPTTAANASASTSDATATDVGTTSSTGHSTAPALNATTSTDGSTATTGSPVDTRKGDLGHGQTTDHPQRQRNATIATDTATTGNPSALGDETTARPATTGDATTAADGSTATTGFPADIGNAAAITGGATVVVEVRAEMVTVDGQLTCAARPTGLARQFSLVDVIRDGTDARGVVGE